MYEMIALLCALLGTLTPYAGAVRPWLELKPSYFMCTAAPMRDIYDKGGFEVQGSVSGPVCMYLDLYGSIGCRKLWGHALNTCEKTSLTVMPIDIGLKPIFNLCERLCYFCAMGPRYFYFHQHNNSPYVNCIITGSGVGLFVNTGFNLLLADALLLGVFGEYSYEKKRICPDPKRPYLFSNGSVQIGGFAVGVSLGYAF